MKCLMKYQWVKLPRKHLPDAKGIMGAWMKLSSRAAFRKGTASYCGYENPVEPGMWAGGVVGLKSILGVKSRSEHELRAAFLVAPNSSKEAIYDKPQKEERPAAGI